jgi:hypothetical protein
MTNASLALGDEWHVKEFSTGDFINFLTGGLRPLSGTPSAAEARCRYRVARLRRTTASMAIMVDHVQMAALTLKKEMPMESRKTAGIVRLRIRQRCTVAGSWASSSSRSSLVELPVDSRQEQPAHTEGSGVDGHRKLVVAVLPKQRGGEGHERHEH